jgi:hypothetical protein
MSKGKMDDTIVMLEGGIERYNIEIKKLEEAISQIRFSLRVVKLTKASLEFYKGALERKNR